MASAPDQQLPLLYKEVVPLTSDRHNAWRARTVDRLHWVINQHAIPLTVDEFALAQRSFPIVFSSGNKPIPLALMGLNDGINVFFDEQGLPTEQVYLPAYVRRYPFLLARLRPEANDLSLCFDPTCEIVGEFSEGTALFENGQPSEHTRGVLEFCQRFEEASERTQVFLDEVLAAGILMDGEFAIKTDEEGGQPYLYRGFKIVNEEKLAALSAQTLKAWNERGFLRAIHAHLFSLATVQALFTKQSSLGKVPRVPAGIEGPAHA